jgi:thioredoxin reductase (NADPH)
MGEKIYDCIIIGAGPGGLQAAIYLGRYNRDVLLLDRGVGRTYHARHIENFLTQRLISGREIIETGMEQARHFNVSIQQSQVIKILKKERFEVYTAHQRYLSRFVIVSSGGRENLPPIENVHVFLGDGFFTCLDCDGYRTTGKKLLVIGNSIHTVRLAFSMKEMFTKDITLILFFYDPPDDYRELLNDEGIPLIKGRPRKIIGKDKIEAVECADGSRVACEVIMSDFGFKLNDEFLAELPLKKDSRDFKYVTNHHFESSLDGLYIVGPLNTGNDQAIIAAGEGAAAAIDIKKRLLDL